jgi:hypothetical protein
MPGNAILTSGKNLVDSSGLLFSSPKEISTGWNIEPQSSAPA